jgi:hypothetical protein
MTIEITRDDLYALTEASRATAGALLYMLKTADGKRCQLVVAAPVKRIRNRRAKKPQAAEASAD